MSAALALVPPDEPSDPPTPLAAPTAEQTPPASPQVGVHALLKPEVWDRIPIDVPDLLALLPRADPCVQDEGDVRHYPTVARVWRKRGQGGQRKVRAPGQNQKAGAVAALAWRDGWCSHGFGDGRTAVCFVVQLDHLVERSQTRGRVAVVLIANARIHTPAEAKLVREVLERHGDQLRLIPTPASDPQANPTERLFPRSAGRSPLIITGTTPWISTGLPSSASSSSMLIRTGPFGTLAVPLRFRRMPHAWLPHNAGAARSDSEEQKAHVDAMRVRLPGSYGTGKK